jgi:hypothetical protein
VFRVSKQIPREPPLCRSALDGIKLAAACAQGRCAGSALLRRTGAPAARDGQPQRVDPSDYQLITQFPQQLARHLHRPVQEERK